MRIISGIHKGRKILEPTDNLTRPLRDLVRESIFNILEHSSLSNKKIFKSTVLDLFSGCGSFGLECISRGAMKVIFVENYSKVLTILRKNIEKFNCTEQSRVVSLDIYLEQKSEKLNEEFDFIFIDPPFKDEKFSKLIFNLKKNKIIKKKTVLIIHRHKNSFDDISSEINILKENIYGKSKIIFACLY